MNEFISILTQPTVCSLLQILILFPVAAGLLLFIVPERYLTFKGIFALMASLITGYLTITLFSSAIQMTSLSEGLRNGCLAMFGAEFVQDASRYATFTLDNLSKLMILFASLFASLIVKTSLGLSKTQSLPPLYWIPQLL